MYQFDFHRFCRRCLRQPPKQIIISFICVFFNMFYVKCDQTHQVFTLFFTTTSDVKILLRKFYSIPLRTYDKKQGQAKYIFKFSVAPSRRLAVPRSIPGEPWVADMLKKTMVPLPSSQERQENYMFFRCFDGPSGGFRESVLESNRSLSQPCQGTARPSSF